ncbi:MAG: M15 family metallopeptidase, partial [Oscillospiraceae bacterium]|nr:M15 family metallopeptidase [Oscillospiraceae bacterium]
FTYFLFGAVPVTAIMFVLYHNTGDTSSLFAMGILDGLLLFGTLLAYGLDVGRLASKDGFCTVSDRGIITANEILPFSAKDGDVIKMLAFDDDYEVVFRRKCYLGITRKYTFPLPKGGVLSNTEADQSVEEVLLETFGLVDADEKEGTYQELRGEELAEQEKEELTEEITETAEETAETASEIEETVNEENPEVSEIISEEEAFLEEDENRDAVLAVPDETIYIKTDEALSLTAADNELEAEVSETGILAEDKPVEEPGELAAEDSESVLEEPVKTAISDLFRDEADGWETAKEEVKAPAKDKIKDVMSIIQAVWVKKAAVIMALILFIAILGTMLFKNRTTPSVDPVPGKNEQEQSNPQPSAPSGQSGQKEEEPFTDVIPKSELQQDDDGVWYATVGGETIVLVNKEHRLPENYGGVNEIAMNAFNKMLEDAEEEDIHLSFVSGYISYEQQASMYESKVAQLGEAAAELVVNPPGASEHQLGVAFDVNVNDSEETLLSIEFAQTEEYKWLLEHCADYGFILRYDKGTRDITGFGFEPWHFRYVGKEVAKAITEDGVTLEEYLGAYPFIDG